MAAADKIVVYYRHIPSEPGASQAALAEQRTAVADYVRESGAVVVADLPRGAGSCRRAWCAHCRFSRRRCARSPLTEAMAGRHRAPSWFMRCRSGR